jgi:hypothetical protein
VPSGTDCSWKRVTGSVGGMSKNLRAGRKPPFLESECRNPLYTDTRRNPLILVEKDLYFHFQVENTYHDLFDRSAFNDIPDAVRVEPASHSLLHAAPLITPF